MQELAEGATRVMLVKGTIMRDRLKILVGTPICTAIGHDWSRLRYDETVGYYQSCGRCTCHDLLASVHTG